jgi:hypothetical protein
MSTLHPAGRALQKRFGVALLAAFAVVSGCAWGSAVSEPENPGDPSIGEAQGALVANAVNSYACTSDGIPGTLVVFSDTIAPRACSIYIPRVGGPSHRYCLRSRGGVESCPDCEDLAREPFGCQIWINP